MSLKLNENQLIAVYLIASGVKPLYFSALDDRFVFASEIKALLHLLPSHLLLDCAALDKYLTYLWCPGVSTPFQSVFKLSPGHAMCISSGRVERSWRWHTASPVKPKNSLRINKDSFIKQIIHFFVFLKYIFNIIIHNNIIF